jgi:hypothetical protein
MSRAARRHHALACVPEHAKYRLSFRASRRQLRRIRSGLARAAQRWTDRGPARNYDAERATFAIDEVFDADPNPEEGAPW